MAERYKSKRKAKFVKDALATKQRVRRAPGGGEPIPKGEKWTDEKREEDAPRKKDGRFESKAAVGEETKYPEHAWRGTYEKGHELNPEGEKLTEKEKKRRWENDVKTDPDYGEEAVQQLKAAYARKKEPGVKKGTKFAINGRIYIAAIDMSMDEFRDSLRNYWKDKKGEGHLGTLDSALVAKRGGRTKAEKEALERSLGSDEDRTVDTLQVVTNEKGRAEMAKLKASSTKKSLREKAKEYKALKQQGHPKFNMETAIQKKELERGGKEGEKHFWPDSDHNDEFAQKLANEDTEGLLSRHGKQIDEVADRLGYSRDDIVEAMKEGDIKLSDLKGFTK